MSVLVVMELQAKPGTGDIIEGAFKAILPDTRAWEGCESVVLYRDQDNADTVFLTEYWGSRAQYEEYFAWRIENGDVAKLGELLAAPPSLRYFDASDA